MKAIFPSLLVGLLAPRCLTGEHQGGHLASVITQHPANAKAATRVTR